MERKRLREKTTIQRKIDRLGRDAGVEFCSSELIFQSNNASRREQQTSLLNQKNC